MSAMYPASTDTPRQYSFLVPLLVTCAVLHKAFLYPRTANASHLQEYGSRGDGKVGKCMQNSSPPCHRGDRIHSRFTTPHSRAVSVLYTTHACPRHRPLPCRVYTPPPQLPPPPSLACSLQNQGPPSIYGVTAVDAPLQTALLSPARLLQRPATTVQWVCRPCSLEMFAGKCAHPWALSGLGWLAEMSVPRLS
ncbi:hypothetical protein K456DRAFT_540285 [Colletotrichum gloeosporioides 23]|nr:hypothetical protein K456DRAFT_540285 [Colletotrichum gloeosporioides 23]